MKEYSQEPLEAVGSCIRTKRTADGGGIFVADCYRKWEKPVEFAFDGTVAESYARRLVACFNACAGIETERLESGSPEWWGRYVCDDRPAMEREIAKLRAEALRIAEKQSREWFAHVSNDYDHDAPGWAHKLAAEQESERAALAEKD